MIKTKTSVIANAAQTGANVDLDPSQSVVAIITTSVLEPR